MNPLPTPNNSAHGLLSVPSAHAAAQTLERLEAVLEQKGIHVFARIDHAAGAASVGLTLRPTTVVIFGNPQVGTPLMQVEQTAGLDLPLKVLVWEDESGSCWLTYNDPAYLAERHGITDRADTVQAMTAALRALTEAAANP
jgi:uncharacterized protein (DUF302 family)